MTDTEYPGLQLHAYLLEHKLMLATAESCTGGMVTAALTHHAGSSVYLDRGFVTYSNDAKTEMLGVSQRTLENHGAVSEETAKAMAEGAVHNSHADISLSITGIAGPGGGSEEKPVGTVCFAWTVPNNTTVTQTRLFKGDRSEVREQAAAHAMRELLSLLSQSKST